MYARVGWLLQSFVPIVVIREDVQMVDWVARVDPRRSRTIFVYTKFFHNTLRNMATTKDLNDYFAGTDTPGLSILGKLAKCSLLPVSIPQAPRSTEPSSFPCSPLRCEPSSYLTGYLSTRHGLMVLVAFKLIVWFEP